MQNYHIRIPAETTKYIEWNNLASGTHSLCKSNSIATCLCENDLLAQRGWKGLPLELSYKVGASIKYEKCIVVTCNLQVSVGLCALQRVIILQRSCFYVFISYQ